MILSPSNAGWPCCSFLDGLSAAYRFDTEGTKGDDSKNSNDLTVSGTPAWSDTDPKNSGYLQFIDSADKIAPADHLSTSQDFSVCGWIRCDTMLSTGDKIYPFTYFDADDAGNTDTGIVFNHSGTDSLFRASYLFDGAQGGLLFSGATFDLSDWVFFALVVQQQAGDYGFHIRVNSSYETADSSSNSHSGTQSWHSQPNSDGHTLTCELDELYIHSGEAWGTNTLDQLYASGSGRFVDADGEF